MNLHKKHTNNIQFQRPLQSVWLLNYHAIIRSPLPIPDWCFIDESIFLAQIKFLKQNFDVLSLRHAISKLRTGSLQKPTVAITFDDGFQNNYEIVLPILRKERLPATIFLTTGLIDTNDTLWSCRLMRALANTKIDKLEWNGSQFYLSGIRAKTHASKLIQKKLKAFPHPELLNELRKIIFELGDDPEYPIEESSPFRMLNRTAITKMAKEELIDFGAHTHSHTILSLLSSEYQQREIKQSIIEVEKLTGKSCTLFAYPNGRSQDYNEESIRILLSCGVKSAVTLVEDVNNPKTPALEMMRYGIGAETSMDEFKSMLKY